MSYVLVIGAKSDLAKALARKYAQNGYDLYLAARKSLDLEEFAGDIRIRTGQIVQILELDVQYFDSHQSFYANLNPKPEGAISVVGYLGDQEKSHTNFRETKQIIEANYTGIVSLFNIIAMDMEERKSGFFVGISSVAGDRGRQSNYQYGSAKAAFSAYLSGLRNRMNSAGVHVMTVKPGFIDTKMTANLDLPRLLTTSPEAAANEIFNAQQKNKNILYTKWFWKWIMLIIRLIPESIFKKLSL